MPTYMLHVSGKTIGRESGLRPMPVQAAGLEDRAPLEEVILATVRRCAPLAGAGGFRVDWSGRRATVYAITRTSDVAVARFTVKDVTGADHQVGGLLPPTYRS